MLKRLVVVTVLAALMLFVTACYIPPDTPVETDAPRPQGGGALSTKSTETEVPKATTEATDMPESTMPEVTITVYAITPQILEIKVGETVKWSNQATLPTTIVSDDGLFESPSIKKGESWEYTFDTAGEYAYHAGNNENLTAKIIVTE